MVFILYYIKPFVYNGEIKVTGKNFKRLDSISLDL